MLSGAQPTADFGVKELHKFDFVPTHFSTERFRKLLSLTETDTVNFQIPIKLDHGQFSRALAKIAYCTAIARYGLKGFERKTIVDFILGKYPFGQFLVGGSIGVDPPTPKNIDHVVALWETQIAQIDSVVAFVRLFSNTGTAKHGMPYYTVVIGARLIDPP
jgi:hypothetical protein